MHRCNTFLSLYSSASLNKLLSLRFVGAVRANIHTVGAQDDLDLNQYLLILN